MTSVKFLHNPKPVPYNPLEWGTGKPVEHIVPSLPRNPSWRYTGKPITQYYGLTKLKRSNVRSNDELVPRPQSVDIGKMFINKPFPAEHPYDSHIPRYAVFPKFDSPEDPKRGVEARGERPISSEMPANPAHTTIVQKIKGFPYRHEYQEIPLESERTALYWTGEDFFDQGAKVYGEKKQYFPFPPRIICPNLQDREGDMKVSDRTANTLRNIEREQWMTSQNLHYTGLGPSNPVITDNLEEKNMTHLMTGKEDDKLYQHFVSTFDPSRPVEGRIPSLKTPLPIHQKTLPTGVAVNPYFLRKMTQNEKEEHRLLYGADYLNLPELPPTFEPQRDVTWRDLDQGMRAGPALERMQEAQVQARKHEPPFPKAEPPQTPGESYLVKLRREQYEDHQQMEAQNRFKDLELQTPARDRSALKYKMDKLHTTEKPFIFYGHEGQYNEERAGLYKTSYDPHSLAFSMNPTDPAAAELNSILPPHINDHMMSLNQSGGISINSGRMCEDNAASLKWSRTFSLHQPELSGDRRDGTEILTTYNWLKGANRKMLLPPPAHLASPRVQEKEFLEKEDTTMGDSYNTVKFLQDHAIVRHQRSEPTSIMSTENQVLNNVRGRAIPRPSKSVQFNKSVSMATEIPTYSGDPIFTSATLPLREEDGRPEELPAPSLDTEERVRVKPFHYTRMAAYPLPPNNDLSDQTTEESMKTVRNSAPGMLETNGSSQRTIHFSDEFVNSDDNNNAARDITNELLNSRYRSFPKRPGKSLHGHGVLDSEYTDQFGSLSTNFMPGGVKNPFATSSSYQSQFPVFDLSYKTDPRFNWQPGSGIPRPQSCLIKLQDSFFKTEVRRNFHELFPEKSPDLRLNNVKGKRIEGSA